MKKGIKIVHENINPKRCSKFNQSQPLNESEAEKVHENSNLKKMKSNAAKFASIINNQSTGKTKINSNKDSKT